MSIGLGGPGNSSSRESVLCGDFTIPSIKVLSLLRTGPPSFPAGVFFAWEPTLLWTVPGGVSSSACFGYELPADCLIVGSLRFVLTSFFDMPKYVSS